MGIWSSPLSPIYQSLSFLLVQALRLLFVSLSLSLSPGRRGMSRHAVWARGISSWKEGEEDRRDGGWRSWESALVLHGPAGMLEVGTWRPLGLRGQPTYSCIRGSSSLEILISASKRPATGNAAAAINVRKTVWKTVWPEYQNGCIFSLWRKWTVLI